MVQIGWSVILVASALSLRVEEVGAGQFDHFWSIWSI